MMNRIFFAVLLAVALGSTADAQTVIVRKRDLNAGQLQTAAPRVSTLPSQQAGLYYSRYNHAVKVSPTALVAGDIPFSYEHKMNSYFTLEGGVGITTRNYIEDFIRGYSFRTDGTTINKPSFSFSINAKFFPDGNAFQDGYYVALNLGHRQYAQEFQTVNDMNIDTVFNESFNWNDFGFTMGYQSRPSERMIFDWYIGAGIRQKNRQVTEYQQIFDPNTGIFNGTYVSMVANNAAPALLGGLKISVLFR